MNYHEISSNQDINYRKSGFLLAGAVAVIYCLLLIRGQHKPYLLIVTALIAVFAVFESLPLRKVVDLLIGLGNRMHRFTNPLIFGLIYVVAVLPTALILKLLGKDVLRLNFDSRISSYWVERTDGKTWKDSFRNQF